MILRSCQRLLLSQPLWFRRSGCVTDLIIPMIPWSIFFIAGISNGFRLGFSRPASWLKSARKNLSLAVLHPEVVDEYLAAELTKSHIASPFSKQDIPEAHISRFGVIPKKYSQQWRLIVDLSHPVGFSVNDGIPKDLCSLSYITVDTAIQHIVNLFGMRNFISKVGCQKCLLLFTSAFT